MRSSVPISVPRAHCGNSSSLPACEWMRSLWFIGLLPEPSLDELALVFAVLRERDVARVIGNVRAGMVARPPGRIFPAQAAIDRDVGAGDGDIVGGSEKPRRCGEGAHDREKAEAEP